VNTTNGETADPTKARRGQPESLYNADLDVLRFLAFLAVYFHHALPHNEGAYRGAGPWLGPMLSAIAVAGGFGVDLFFVLSSYLITRLLVAELRLRGKVDIGNFLIRRALRIWPLYFVFLAACVFVVPHLVPGQSFGEQLPWFLCFLGNWSVAKWGYPASVAAPLWSVSIEEQFYVLWPLLLLVFGFRRLLPLAIILLAIASATRYWLYRNSAVHPAVWTNTFARLGPIATGVLLAAAASVHKPFMSRATSMALVVTGALLVPASLLLLGSHATAGRSSLALYPLVAGACTLVVAGVVWCKERVLQPPGARADRVLIHLGRISYGLYVFHVLGLAIIRQTNLVDGLPAIASLVIDTAFALAFTIVAAMLSYQVLELPFLRLKRKFAAVDSEPRARSPRGPQ
jgi:peptidoglycan/LPS O-acetylase OafA/YrhL